MNTFRGARHGVRVIRKERQRPENPIQMAGCFAYAQHDVMRRRFAAPGITGKGDVSLTLNMTWNRDVSLTPGMTGRKCLSPGAGIHTAPRKCRDGACPVFLKTDHMDKTRQAASLQPCGEFCVVGQDIVAAVAAVESYSHTSFGRSASGRRIQRKAGCFATPGMAGKEPMATTPDMASLALSAR